MGFSAKQLHALRRDVKREHVRTRLSNGRELAYIEGGHAIAEANRIFGFDGWDRETVESRCVITRENRGTFLVVYTSKVRITVRTDGEKIVREGNGCGEARGVSAGEAHDLALKISETDATKRALATFGKPFGLALYINGKSGRKDEGTVVGAAPETVAPFQEIGAPELPKAIDQLPAGTRSNGSHEPERTSSNGIDKSELKIGAAKRHRHKSHLRYVASQPCLLCERQPSDPHHLRFAQPRGLGMKVSDEFTVPLCREHHRQLHHSGNENAWWHDMGIEPLVIAKTLWETTQAKSGSTPGNKEKAL
jgi:hypothetical protein